MLQTQSAAPDVSPRRSLELRTEKDFMAEKRRMHEDIYFRLVIKK